MNTPGTTPSVDDRYWVPLPDGLSVDDAKAALAALAEVQAANLAAADAVARRTVATDAIHALFMPPGARR